MQVATLLRCGSVFVADMFGEQKRLMIANVLDAQMLDVEPVGDVQREPADPTSGGAEHLPVAEVNAEALAGTVRSRTPNSPTHRGVA